MPTTLRDIASVLGIQLPHGADADRVVTGVAEITDAGPGDIALLGSSKYLAPAASTRAAAVVVSRKLLGQHSVRISPVLLAVDNADLSFAKLLEYFAPEADIPDVGVHPMAFVDKSAKVDPSARVGPFVSIGKRVTIAAGAVLYPSVTIGDDCSVGQACVFHPAVVIRHRCVIGNRVILHGNVVVGADGFGYRFDGKQHVKIPQIGTVVIEDDVEIGANSCIDRAKTGVTRIGRGTKIDNLVQIGHNCNIGPLNVFTAGCSIGGSVTTGVCVVIGGHAAVRDHLTLADRTQVAAFSGVINNTKPGEIIGGYHAHDLRQTLREIATFEKLPELVRRVKRIEDREKKLPKDQLLDT